MKKFITYFVFLLILLIPLTSNAEYYKATVTRKSQNLYKIEYTSLYIITKYCYEYCYYEDVIIKYETYSFDNKIIFGDTECEINKIFRVK